jgi:GPI ethanolamine phosphate transferase 3 subunit O
MRTLRIRVLSGETRQDDALAVVGALLLGQRFFFATGQQAVVSAIRWAPGFVGVDDARLLWLSGALVTVTFFAGPLLAVMWAATPGGARPRALLLVVVVRAALAAACLAATLVLRRHLMLWKVFAPRYTRWRDTASVRGPCALTGRPA